MLADWLQGTNMYTLYQSYGVDVGALFLTGFSSAAVFGTFLGLFVDRFGRRNGCIVFCLLEVCDRSRVKITNYRCCCCCCCCGGGGGGGGLAAAPVLPPSFAQLRRGRLLRAGYLSIMYERACSGPGFSKRNVR